MLERAFSFRTVEAKQEKVSTTLNVAQVKRDSFCFRGKQYLQYVFCSVTKVELLFTKYFKLTLAKLALFIVFDACFECLTVLADDFVFTCESCPKGKNIGSLSYILCGNAVNVIYPDVADHLFFLNSQFNLA